jgi:hypothetical protein
MTAEPPFEINRAPVLTLWAAIVAERLGFDHDEALTLGRSVAGLTAQSKAVTLGLFEPTAQAVKEKREAASDGGEFRVALLGRAVPAVRTPQGIRAVEKGKPSDPASVERYLASKFNEHLIPATRAMAELAMSYPPDRLAEVGFRLYERFRPAVAKGVEGWGAAGVLDLNVIRELAAR